MKNLSGLEALGLICKNETVLDPVSHIKYKLSSCGSKIMCAPINSNEWYESACQGIYWGCTEDKFEIYKQFDLSLEDAISFMKQHDGKVVETNELNNREYCMIDKQLMVWNGGKKRWQKASTYINTLLFVKFRKA